MSYFDWDLESLRCGISERVCNTIGTLVTIALGISGISCLIVGLVCSNSGSWVSNKTQCESIYITGILMTFLIGVIVVFGLFICLIENCDKRNKPVIVANPVRRRSVDETSGRSRSNSNERKRGPKLSALSSPKLCAKKKHSPLQVLVV